jgi:hypothetical protein
MLHACSGYCLKQVRGVGERVCRFFGCKESSLTTVEKDGKKMLYGRKEPSETPNLTKNHRGHYVCELPRDHPRMVQHIRGMLDIWRANCDQTCILSLGADPKNPDPRDVNQTANYLTGYMCKGMEGGFGGIVEANQATLNALDPDTDGFKCINKIVNKSVGSRDIAEPCCIYELMHLPLTRSSVSFVRVPLGTFRCLREKKPKKGDTGDNDQAGDDKMPVSKDNIVDRYKDRMKKGPQGPQTYRDENDQVMDLAFICLYDWASGPGQGGGPMKHKVGSFCPVPTGKNTTCRWPLQHEYCMSILKLYSPGWSEETDLSCGAR